MGGFPSDDDANRISYIIRHILLPLRLVSISVDISKMEYCYEYVEGGKGSVWSVKKQCRNLTAHELASPDSLTDLSLLDGQLSIPTPNVAEESSVAFPRPKSLDSLTPIFNNSYYFFLLVLFYILLGILGFLYLRRSRVRKSDFIKSPLTIFFDQVLGYGSMGTVVFKGIYCERRVAVKRILLPPALEKPQFENEINILQSSDHHPNIIRYYYHEFRDSFLYIALEQCECSLDILPNDLALQASISFPMIKALFEGLDYLHSVLNIIHRDLKPSNVLLPYSREKLLLADFGIGKILSPDHTNSMRTICGTSGWRAPEVILLEQAGSASIKYRSYSDRFSVDVFSAGLVLYYLLTGGRHPYDIIPPPIHTDVKTPISPGSSSGDDIANGGSYCTIEQALPCTLEMMILRGVPDLSSLRSSRSTSFLFSPEEASDLILKMLHKDPLRRPTMKQVMAHPFFWSPSKKLDFLCDISDRLSGQSIPDRGDGLGGRNSSGDRNEGFYYYGGGPPPGIALLAKDNEILFRSILASWKRFSSLYDLNWIEKLSPAIKSAILTDQRRSYHSGKIVDLLRAIRNRKSHYSELDLLQRSEFGALPDHFYQYWASRFPFLVICCWNGLFHSGLADLPEEVVLRHYLRDYLHPG